MQSINFVLIFISQIILVLSLGGMAYLAVHKMPNLSHLSSESSLGNKHRLRVIFLAKGKKAGEAAGKAAKVSTQKSLQYSAKFASQLTSKIYKIARKPETIRVQENPQERVERTSSIEQGHGYWQNLKDKGKTKAKRPRKTVKKEI